jgi:hypothetical protein
LAAQHSSKRATVERHHTKVAKETTGMMLCKQDGWFDWDLGRRRLRRAGRGGAAVGGWPEEEGGRGYSGGFVGDILRPAAKL